MARLLVIDDEKFARISLRRILERAGHQVVEATNGAEGLAKFRAEKFDLILTDIIMPEKEGGEMIGELVRDYPDVRIIAMSGGGRTGNLDFLKLALQRGARRILAKPFSNAELISAVEAVLAEP